jgi:preprotein translocase subunit SecD
MKRNLQIKSLIILGVVLACIFGVIGFPKSKDELIANWQKNIHLGLDLRGGTYLVLQVQEQDAFNSEANTVADQIRQAAQKAGIPVSQVDAQEAKSLAEASSVAVLAKGVPATQAGQFRQLLTQQFPGWNLTTLNSTDYRLTLKNTEAIQMRQQILAQTKNTIEKKINGLGVSESSVQQRRSDTDAELLVQLPGVDDPARVKQILQTAAVLELYEVKGGPFPSREEALAQNGGVLPAGTKLVHSRNGANETWYLLNRAPEIKGQDIQNARSQQGQTGTWETSFVLSQTAAKRFEAFTGAHIGDRLAIVLDGNVLTAPNIKGQISDNGVIENVGTQEEASDLALNLRAGSLPASIVYLQESTVGPSLGNDSIREGLLAGVTGLIAVVLAMLVYYKRAGVNAVLALILNSIILIACLSYFDAVLTLPGIAGVILTIGMAVDSNVLIFERIREELRTGKSVRAAVDTGFDKALVTIIDTHVTTVVSCAILFLLGSGPVKGFAVTLVIGLVANIFTAVFVSKTIFDWELSRPTAAVRLSI